MKQLVIENQMQLIILQEILKDYPYLTNNSGFEESAVGKQVRLELLDKITKVLK